MRGIIQRVLTGLTIGAGVSIIAVGSVCWRDKSFLSFSNYAYQEIVTAEPEQGFENIAGYWGSQSFYWHEIVTSRRYALEVLRQLGQEPGSRLGLLHAASVHRCLEFAPDRKESLYLLVDFTESPYEVPFRDDLSQDFQAHAAAFVVLLKENGIEAYQNGNIVFQSVDIGSWQIMAQQNWLRFLLVGCIVGAVVALALEFMRTPNQALQTTRVTRTSV